MTLSKLGLILNYKNDYSRNRKNTTEFWFKNEGWIKDEKIPFIDVQGDEYIYSSYIEKLIFLYPKEVGSWKNAQVFYIELSDKRVGELFLLENVGVPKVGDLLMYADRSTHVDDKGNYIIRINYEKQNAVDIYRNPLDHLEFTDDLIGDINKVAYARHMTSTEDWVDSMDYARDKFK